MISSKCIEFYLLSLTKSSELGLACSKSTERIKAGAGTGNSCLQIFTSERLQGSGCFQERPEILKTSSEVVVAQQVYLFRL